MPPKKTEHASATAGGQTQPQTDNAADDKTARSAMETIDLSQLPELAAAKDQLLRLQAEMQNLRNRTSREIADERRYAALPVLRDLLPVIDNINRAIEAAEKAGEAENLLAGFRLVKQQLESILNRYHAEPITGEGQPFDPHFQAAILQQPSAEVPSGNVMMVTLPGYKLHDRVIRPAQVIVSSGPPS